MPRTSATRAGWQRMLDQVIQNRQVLLVRVIGKSYEVGKNRFVRGRQPVVGISPGRALQHGLQENLARAVGARRQRLVAALAQHFLHRGDAHPRAHQPLQRRIGSLRQPLHPNLQLRAFQARRLGNLLQAGGHHAGFLQRQAQPLRLLDGDGAHQHRLAAQVVLL